MPGESQSQELLFGVQNPANEKLFNDRFAHLFQEDESKAWVDVYRPNGTPTVPIPASTASQSSGNAPTPNSATAPRVAENIDYLGRCAVRYYRERNVEDLRSRIEQISNAGDTHVTSSLPKRPIICIVRQVHSWSKLLTSRALLDDVLSMFDPRVNDFVLPFGLRIAETDIGGPRLWFYPTSFGRAGQDVEHAKYYDCAYTLKYVERSRRNLPDRPWAERQTTIAIHRSELDGWVLVSPSTPMQEYLDRYLRALNDEESANTFVIHMLFIEAAMMNWQSYMAYLTAETNGIADRAIVNTFGRLNDEDNIKTLEMDDIQKLQTVQDRIIDMFAMLDSTIDIARSLEEKYHLFHLQLDMVTKSRIRSDPIAFAFHEKLQDLRFTRQKLESLHERVKAIGQLSSSALDLENGHSLRALAEEARREGKAMRSLTEKATQDAAAVKVITVITMIYLPLTVVANFFSTQFVTQRSVGGGHTIEVADNWWILAAVGFPLTAVTFLMWWAISQRMLLIDALQELGTRSTKQLRVLASTRGSKKSVSDQESLAGSAMVSGAVLN